MLILHTKFHLRHGSVWSYKPNDNIINDHIKRLTLIIYCMVILLRMCSFDHTNEIIPLSAVTLSGLHFQTVTFRVELPLSRPVAWCRRSWGRPDKSQGSAEAPRSADHPTRATWLGRDPGSVDNNLYYRNLSMAEKVNNPVKFKLNTTLFLYLQLRWNLLNLKIKNVGILGLNH